MANIRQSILVRNDLGLSVGLLAAQVAHLHMEGIRNLLCESLKEPTSSKGIFIDFKNMGGDGADLEDWLPDPYIFVHKVPCLEVLQLFEKEFRAAKIPVYLWRDTITIDISPTQKKVLFPVLVGISVGPCDSDRIKAIISDLPLL